MSAIDLAITHLNAPVGNALSAAQLSDALSAGSVRTLPPVPAALVLSIFAELEPQLILRCVREVSASVANANRLYMEWLSDTPLHITRWERAVEYLL